MPKAPLSIADVETALDECVRQPVSEREAYLQRVWADRPEVIEEVRSLLSFLPDPECFDDLPPAIDEDLARIGASVGAFHLESLIGRGSTGAVYRAQQSSPARRVAVKLLRREYAGPSALRRFKREGELLGRLNHPAIARIYAMGVEQGQGFAEPYIAMELIEDARTIDTWWNAETAPPLKERLQVFSLLCDGVHHAHLRGIVHRDLKPANVLFGRDQTPRLVDFSIARTTGDGAQEETLSTRVGAIVGTLSYMSPEQVSGSIDKIDARTDVYALGALLYELLSGVRACDVDQLPLHEAARVICVVGPRSLSSLSRALRGDLETIVEKAMAKEPEARYESAAALAVDVRRFVHDEAILARPPSRIATAQRFVRKHRVGVAVFALILSAIGLGYASSVAANARTARALYLSSLARTELLAELGESVAASEALARTPRGEWTWVHHALDRALDDRALALELPVSEIPHALALVPQKQAAVCSLGALVQFVNLVDLSKFGEVNLGAPVTALVLSEDARFAFAGCLDGTVWEVDAGVVDPTSPPRLIGALSSACASAAISPNGKTLLVGTASSGVEAFDLSQNTHAPLPLPAQLGTEVGRIVSIAWEPSGESSLLASASHGILQWWPERGVTAWIVDCRGGVVSVVWSPSGEKFAYASNMEIFLSDSKTTAAHRVVSTRHPIRAIAFSPNGRAIASVGHDARIHVFDLFGSALVTRFSPDGPQSAVAWVDDDTVISAGVGVATYEMVEPFPRIVLHSRDDGTRGRSSACWLTPHRIRFIDEHGEARDCSMISPPQGVVRETEIPDGCATAMSRDGRRGAIALPTGGVAFIEPNGERTPCIGEGQFVHLAFSLDGAYLAATDREGAIWVIELRNASVIARWIPPKGEEALGATWTGRFTMLTASNQHNMRLTFPADGEAEWLAQRTGYFGQSRIVRGGSANYYAADEAPTILEVESDGSVGRRYAGGLGGSLAVAESPNGLLVATGGRDGRIHLFERSTQDELASFPTIADAVVTLEWSPDGMALLVTGDEGSLEVIDSKSLRRRYAERLLWLE